MATNKLITMKQFNGTDYDTLYPKTKIEQVEGAYTQQQILADSTKALYGLGAEAVPDDVLSILGKYSQHWWKRRSKQKLPTPSTSTTKVYLSSSYSSGARVIYYSDSVVLNENGSISLVNEQSTTVKSSESTGFPNCIVLKGKYIRNAYSPDSNAIYFIPEDATFNQETSPNKAVTVSGYKVSAETVTSEWEFVQSTDRNTYPDSGESGGYEYQYLGIPFDNAVTAPKIATGNYFGTGTYGSSNPNSLLFDFKPRVVLIFYSRYVKATNPFYDQGNALGTFIFNPYGMSNDSYTQYGYYADIVSNNTQNCYAKFDDTTNTLYWYNTSDSSYQGNTGGGSCQYHYVAIG